MEKLNINFNPYYMSTYTVFNENDIVNGTDLGQIGNILLMNAKVSYQILDQLGIYFNARNLNSQEKNQHYGTEEIHAFVTGGLKFGL